MSEDTKKQSQSDITPEQQEDMLLDEVITLPNGEKITRREARQNSISLVAKAFREARSNGYLSKSEWIVSASTNVVDTMFGIFAWMDQMKDMQKSSSEIVAKLAKDSTPMVNGAYQKAMEIVQVSSKKEEALKAIEALIIKPKEEVNSNEDNKK